MEISVSASNNFIDFDKIVACIETLKFGTVTNIRKNDYTFKTFSNATDVICKLTENVKQINFDVDDVETFFLVLKKHWFFRKGIHTKNFNKKGNRKKDTRNGA